MKATAWGETEDSMAATLFFWTPEQVSQGYKKVGSRNKKRWKEFWKTSMKGVQHDSGWMVLKKDVLNNNWFT